MKVDVAFLKGDVAFIKSTRRRAQRRVLNGDARCRLWNTIMIYPISHFTIHFYEFCPPPMLPLCTVVSIAYRWVSTVTLCDILASLVVMSVVSKLVLDCGLGKDVVLVLLFMLVSHFLQRNRPFTSVRNFCPLIQYSRKLIL